MPISEDMRSNDATDRAAITRRRALKLGAGALGLAAGSGWVKPAIASVKLKPGCSGSPPPGRPSCEVWKDATVIDRFGQHLTVSGSLKIRNASEVMIVVEKIADTVQYREGTKWKDAPTVIQSLSSCGPGSCIQVHDSCSGEYTVTAMVPLAAQKFRNRLEVKLLHRDKIFQYTADVEQDFFQEPPEPPPSEQPPPPSEEPPPPSSEPPPPSSEPPPPSSEPPPSEPPPSPSPP